MTWTVEQGDCLHVLKTLADSSVDAVVTDPPAGISFMGKAWDGDRGGRRQWVAWLTEVMGECYRVLKPGGHALVWALPRTAHWTATAIEDAGLDIRDVIVHLFGSGFGGKGNNVGKAIDAVAVGTPSDIETITAPATDAAKKWKGWNTTLSPAAEHWILARKPLQGTVAANVQAHGTGALNIDGCRIDLNGRDKTSGGCKATKPIHGGGISGSQTDNTVGRWPKNVVLSHAEECTEAGCVPGCPVAGIDEQSGETKSAPATIGTRPVTSNAYDTRYPPKKRSTVGGGGSGGASRYYYVAKPSTKERNAGLEGLPAKRVSGYEGGAIVSADHPETAPSKEHAARNHHPTVKPLTLMRYLCRLITPPGGLVLDPFTGSGTTGMAAVAEGFAFLGIELDTEYAEIARRRIAWQDARGRQGRLL